MTDRGAADSLDYPPREHLWLWVAIGLAAVVVRYLYVFHLHPPNQHVFSDMELYLYTAVREFSGSTEPFLTLRHGLLSRTLALSFVFFGVGNTQVYWLQLFWSAGSVFLTYAAARRVLSPRPALVAFAIQAFNMLDIGLLGYWLTEPAFEFLTLAVVWGLLRWRESGGRMRWLVLTGVLMAGQVMARDNALLLLPLFAVWVAAQAGGRVPHRLRAAGVLVVVCCLLLVPQAVRNHRMIGHWLPGTSRAPMFWHVPSPYVLVHGRGSNTHLVLSQPRRRGLGYGPIAGRLAASHFPARPRRPSGQPL